MLDPECEQALHTTSNASVDLDIYDLTLGFHKSGGLNIGPKSEGLLL